MRKEGNETFMNTGNINFFEKFFMKMKFFFKKDNSELGEVISLSDILKCVVESIVYTLFIILIFCQNILTFYIFLSSIKFRQDFKYFKNKTS